MGIATTATRAARIIDRRLIEVHPGIARGFLNRHKYRLRMLLSPVDSPTLTSHTRNQI